MSKRDISYKTGCEELTINAGKIWERYIKSLLVIHEE